LKTSIVQIIILIIISPLFLYYSDKETIEKILSSKYINIHSSYNMDKIGHCYKISTNLYQDIAFINCNISPNYNHNYLISQFYYKNNVWANFTKELMVGEEDSTASYSKLYIPAYISSKYFHHIYE